MRGTETTMMLADRVHADSMGVRHNFGLSLVISVCDECGAVVMDDKRHDEWHERVGAGNGDNDHE